MISCLIVHPETAQRQIEIENILNGLKLSKNHPNTLWFSQEEKLGIGEARKIQDFLSLKPYQGKSQAVVLLRAESLTLDAQNALLKTLEEPGKDVSIILGAASEDQLLPTIISRCKVINLQNGSTPNVEQKYQDNIEKLLESNMEQRFTFIEKLEDRENFLHALTVYFRHKILEDNIEFTKDLVEAEKWAKHNVNIRAILEYLMLKMPQGQEEK